MTNRCVITKGDTRQYCALFKTKTCSIKHYIVLKLQVGHPAKALCVTNRNKEAPSAH